MNLSDLNELDFSNVGNWPVAAKSIAILAICAVVAGGVVWFDTLKQQEQLDGIKQQEGQLKESIKIKARNAANLEQLKQQLEEMREDFKKLSRQLPNKTEVAALLVDISQTGLSSGLEFELFKPEGENRKDFYAELPIKIRVNGGYHEFGTFASGIAALPRIVTLHDISINASAGNPENLIMNATAKTYRYLDDEEQVIAGAKEGGKKR
jgi:type IV pilus assembly protein PilO